MNSKSAEYKAWGAMKNRCYNKNMKNYHNYGGRGIKVCDRWLNSSKNFLKDMGEKPSALHSLDRIDNDGDYSPENCRWATKSEQQQNKRVGLVRTRINKSKSLKSTSTHIGVSYCTRNEAWRARKTLRGKFLLNRYLPTEAEAIEVYEEFLKI